MYLHHDPCDPMRTPEETRSAWMLAEARAGARQRRLERRRDRLGRLIAAVTGVR
jgi:hypothetical protein